MEALCVKRKFIDPRLCIQKCTQRNVHPHSCHKAEICASCMHNNENTANNAVLSLSFRASSQITISVKVKYSKNVTAIICGISRTDSYAKKPHLMQGYAKLLDRRYATYANFVITDRKSVV